MSDGVWTAGALLEAMWGLRATPDFWAVAPVASLPFCWALDLGFTLLGSKAGGSEVGWWALLHKDRLTSTSGSLRLGMCGLMWQRGDVVGLNLHWVVAPCHHKDLGKREEEADLRQTGVRGQFQRRVGCPAVSVSAITGPGSRG